MRHIENFTYISRQISKHARCVIPNCDKNPSFLDDRTVKVNKRKSENKVRCLVNGKMTQR